MKRLVAAFAILFTSPAPAYFVAALVAPQAPKPSIVHITAQNFEAEVMQSNIPVFLDFTADWCPGCVMLKPILEEAAAQHPGRLKVAFVDYDKNKELRDRFRINGIPQLFIFVNGKQVDHLIGWPSEKEVHEFVQRAIDRWTTK